MTVMKIDTIDIRIGIIDIITNVRVDSIISMRVDIIISIDLAFYLTIGGTQVRKNIILLRSLNKWPLR